MTTVRAKAPLSAMMAICLADTIEHGGKLIRHDGGYWSWPGCAKRAGGIPVDFFGTTTVDALVARGMFKYVEWKDGRKHFPVAAAVKPGALENGCGNG